MKKRKPDPRQISLDLGFPDSPEHGAADGHEPGAADGRESGTADGPSGARPVGRSRGKGQGQGLGQGQGRGQVRGRGRAHRPGDRAARVASDWDSLQEHAPETSSTTATLPPADLPNVGLPPSAIPREDLPTAGPIHESPSAAGLPTDPDAWAEPFDPCPIVSTPPEDEPQSDLALPEGPVDFILPTRIAWAGRRPYSLVASLLQPGDPVRLQREPDNPHDPHAIRIVNRDGESAGYVYAEEAAWLSLLLYVSPPERDDSAVTVNDGRHVAIEIRLHLAEAWPAFTIVAIFGLRSDRFSRQFNLEGNPFLRPLAPLNRRYLANYDYFHMPPAIVEAYAALRQRFG